MKIKMTRKEFMSAAGKATGIGVLVVAATFAGYWIGVLVMWALVSIFGVKLGAAIYLVLWVASCVWVFLTVFKKDKYGFRA